MGIFNYLFSAGVAAKCMKNHEKKESVQRYRAQQDALSILREQKHSADHAAYEEVANRIAHYYDGEFGKYVVGERRNLTKEFEIAYQTYKSLEPKQPFLRPLEEYPFQPQRLPGTGETRFGYDIEYKEASLIEYSIAEARRWAAINGYAPDNVLNSIFCGWNPYHGTDERYCTVSQLENMLKYVVHESNGTFWRGTYKDAIAQLKQQDDFLNQCLEDKTICPYDRWDIVGWSNREQLEDSWRLQLLGYSNSVAPHYPDSVMKSFAQFCIDYGIDSRFEKYYTLSLPTKNQRKELRIVADKKIAELQASCVK